MFVRCVDPLGREGPMGTHSRWMTVMRSNINARIDRMEDPTKMLDQLVLDMRGQLVEAKKAVCIAIADERKLARMAEQHTSEVRVWENRAMLALRAGAEELARAALVRKREQEELANTYSAQWQEQKRSVDALRVALSGLEARISEAARQRTVLQARVARAQAQRTIAATLSNIEGVSAWSTVERLEAKVEQIEADAEAMCELEWSGDASLEAQFRALAAGNVDDELAALKRKMALAEPAAPKALPGRR